MSDLDFDLDPAGSYDHDIEVQYRDLDSRKHVNHAVYVTYAEQAKGAFFADVLGTSLADVNSVVRHLEVDYRAPVGDGEVVGVRLAPVAVGETSLTIGYELRVGDRLVAAARTVSVLLDEENRPRPLPDGWRDRLASALD